MGEVRYESSILQISRYNFMNSHASKKSFEELGPDFVVQFLATQRGGDITLTLFAIRR